MPGRATGDQKTASGRAGGGEGVSGLERHSERGGTRARWGKVGHKEITAHGEEDHDDDHTQNDYYNDRIVGDGSGPGGTSRQSGRLRPCLGQQGPRRARRPGLGGPATRAERATGNTRGSAAFTGNGDHRPNPILGVNLPSLVSMNCSLDPATRWKRLGGGTDQHPCISDGTAEPMSAGERFTTPPNAFYDRNRPRNEDP